MKIDKNNGITIVALIITIVVLVILSSVAIVFFTNIIGEAKEASFKYNLAEAKENFNKYSIFLKESKETYDISTLNWDGVNAPTGTAKINKYPNEDSIEDIIGTKYKLLQNKLIIDNRSIICNELL